MITCNSCSSTNISTGKMKNMCRDCDNVFDKLICPLCSSINITTGKMKHFCVDCDNIFDKLISCQNEEKKEEIISSVDKHDLTHSKILECKITDNNNNLISESKKYSTILKDIFKKMGRQSVLELEKSNITNEKINGFQGFFWIEELSLSYQNKNSNETMKDILELVNKKYYNIKMIIRLTNDIIITIG